MIKDQQSKHGDINCPCIISVFININSKMNTASQLFKHHNSNIIIHLYYVIATYIFPLTHQNYLKGKKAAIECWIYLWCNLKITCNFLTLLKIKILYITY